jgi:hypothetical protein
MDYVKFVNNQITGNPTDPANMISDNCFGYSRLSSHFTETQLGHTNALKLAGGGTYQGHYRHYGIDIRRSKNGGALENELPTGNKTHILFGKIQTDPDMIFIKIETHGIFGGKEEAPTTGAAPSYLSTLYKNLPGAELLQHAASYIKAQGVKQLERSVPWEVKDWLSFFVDFDDAQYFRKERIPYKIIYDIGALISQSSMLPNHSRSFIQWTLLLGIRYPYLIMQYCETLDQKYLDLLRKFIKTYQGSTLVSGGRFEQDLESIIICLHQDTYLYDQLKELVNDVVQQYDRNDMRTGREVLLTQCDLLSSYAYSTNPDKNALDIIGTLESLQAGMKMPFNTQNIVYNISRIRQMFVQNVAQKLRATQRPEHTSPVDGPLVHLTSCYEKLYDEFQTYISAFEYILNTGVNKQTIFNLAKAQKDLSESLIRRLPYRQLIRSAPLILDSALQQKVISAIQTKIETSYGQKPSDAALLRYVTLDLPEQLFKDVIPSHLLTHIDEINRQHKDHIYALQSRTFARRIVLQNTSNKRLLVKGVKGNNVLWQVVLEKNAHVDIGSLVPQEMGNNADKVTYEPYGTVWGTVAAAQAEISRLALRSIFGAPVSNPELDLRPIVQQETSRIGDIFYLCCIISSEALQDARRIVYTQKTVGSYVFNKTEAIKESWKNAFPTIVYYENRPIMEGGAWKFESVKEQFPDDLARYILGLPRGNVTERQVQNRAQRLLDEWNVDMYDFDVIRQINIINSYIRWARDQILSNLQGQPGARQAAAMPAEEAPSVAPQPQQTPRSNQ